MQSPPPAVFFGFPNYIILGFWELICYDYLIQVHIYFYIFGLILHCIPYIAEFQRRLGKPFWHLSCLILNGLQNCWDLRNDFPAWCSTYSAWRSHCPLEDLASKYMLLPSHMSMYHILSLYCWARIDQTSCSVVQET